MSKNTQIGELINYISVNESGNVVLSNGHLVATQNYVSTAVANLVDAAPTTLDTLNELAAALGDDPNFATTLTTSIGGKLSLTGGTLSGALNGTSASFTGAIISTGGWIQFANNFGIEGRNAANTAYRTVLKLNTSNQLEIGRDSDISSIILGTASAVNALTIASTGAATFSSSVTANGIMSLSDDGTYGSTYKTLGFTGNSNGSHRIFAGTADNIYIAAATARGIEFWTNGIGSTRMIINSSGNVGIGTPSPSQRLHVANSAGGVVAFLQSTATNGEPTISLEGRNSSGTVRSATFKYDNADLLRIGTSSPIDFRFETNDVERMRITSGGYLKLPQSRILGDSDICFIDLYNPNTGNLRLTNTSSSSEFGNIVLSTNNTQRMRITLDGTIAFNGNSTPNGGGLDKLSLGFADGAYGWIQTWGGRPFSINSQGNNVLIGKTSDSGYRLQVNGGTQASSFITDSGTTLISTFSVGYTTFYTVSNYQNAIYLVTLQLNGYSNYTAYATICQNDSGLVIMNQVNNVAYIQVSGLNIQGSQNSGAAQNMVWKIIKIN